MLLDCIHFVVVGNVAWCCKSSCETSGNVSVEFHQTKATIQPQPTISVVEIRKKNCDFVQFYKPKKERNAKIEIKQK